MVFFPFQKETPMASPIIPVQPAGPTDEELDHTPIDFGQYKGRTPSQVAVINPKYLVWMHDTVVNRGKLMSELLYEDCVKAPTTRQFTPVLPKPAVPPKAFDSYSEEDDSPF